MHTPIRALLRPPTLSAYCLGALLLVALSTPLYAAPVVSASVSPATLPVTGGDITISANVTDSGSQAITGVSAHILRNDGYGWNIALANGGSGSAYTGILPVSASNTSNAPYTYTATVTATNAQNVSSTAAATGKTVQANDNTPPTIAPASISPATLPVTGGFITVTANVTDPNYRAITGVSAHIQRTDGYGWNISLAKTGSGNTYSGTLAVSASNTSSADYVYTATVSATNDLNLSGSVAAAGNTVQAHDNAPPTISPSSISPATLPITGGVITMTATVTDPNHRAITSVTAHIQRSDGYGWNITLANGGSGSVYSGTLAISQHNTSDSPYIYNAVVAAKNDLNLSNSAAVPGNTVQANSGPPPNLIPVLYTTDPTMPVLSPAAIAANGPDLFLTIKGGNFLTGATVLFNGVNLTPSSIASTQITVTVPAALIADPGSYAVSVFNPSGGGASNSVNLNVSDQELASITLTPTSVKGGSANASGVVALNRKAATTATIALMSSDPTVLSVPSSVTINAASSSTTFTATSHTVTSSTAVTITATYAGESRTAIVTVTP